MTIAFQNYADGGDLNSACLPDEDNGDADGDNNGLETCRQFLFLNNRIEVEDPECGRFKFSTCLICSTNSKL